MNLSGCDLFKTILSQIKIFDLFKTILIDLNKDLWPVQNDITSKRFVTCSKRYLWLVQNDNVLNKDLWLVQNDNVLNNDLWLVQNDNVLNNDLWLVQNDIDLNKDLWPVQNDITSKRFVTPHLCLYDHGEICPKGIYFYHYPDKASLCFFS